MLATFPAFTSGFFTSTVGMRSLWLGIAASSLIFLSGYGGMVSLGQTALYGIAGLTMADLVASEGGSQHNHLFGLSLGDNGALGRRRRRNRRRHDRRASVRRDRARAYGIYFLMLTLALGVLVYYFYGQVEGLSGFGGVNSVDRPERRRRSGLRTGGSTTRRSSARRSSTS